MNIKYYFIRVLRKIFKFNAIKNSKLDKKSRLTYNIQMVNSLLGRFSYIGSNTKVFCTSIGKFCSIAEDCIIGGPSHSINYVSTSPVFNNGRNIFFKNFAKLDYDAYENTIIENDVWIGSMCMIKAGVKIGNGAVIGMGSVVTHDVPPYEIWAGNPAKFIRKRFDDETIRHLQKIQWWDFPEEKLHCVGKYFDSPDLFINKMKKDDDL